MLFRAKGQWFKMSLTIKEWLPQVEEFKHCGREAMDHLLFHRDPARPQFIDSGYFFSPADGIVVCQDTYKPKEKMVDIKGAFFTLQDLVQDDTFDKECLVVNVFMTFYDPHYNRIPMAGILNYKKLEPITTNNYPMLLSEEKLLDGIIDKSCVEWFKKNERMLNTIYSPDYDLSYQVLQIADDDVDVIQHFDTDQSQYFQQNQRFSMIRWGSPCSLIIPIDNRYDYELCLKPMIHVEAGVDALVKIAKR